MNNTMLFCHHYPTLVEHAFRLLLPYCGMGSGIPRVLEGWPQIELISEVTGNQFTARVKRPAPQWQEATEQVTGQVSPVEALEHLTETERKILAALCAQPQHRSALLKELGYRQPTGNYKAAMAKLLRRGWIEYILPEKPNSRLQKYRLTDSGRQYLQQIKNEAQP